MFITNIQNEWDVKLKAGQRMVPTKITKEGNRLFLKFGFNKTLMAEIKEMQGAKYHGYDEHNPRKLWSVLDSDRNRFQLGYLACPGGNDPNNPYYWYDRPLTDREPTRKLYAHQRDLFKHGLTRHYCIFAAEMGTGKTLAAFEVIEASGADWALWVGPKPALVSVKLEYAKWGCKFAVQYVTYEGLKKLLEDWPSGRRPPQIVIFDESSRLKNPTAQRTQVAAHLASSIRKEWGFDGYVIEMSGSPAPKSPVDWWSQCEIAQPGFLREGDINKLKKRLAVIETRESFVGGGAYPHLVTWRDDVNKCNLCGLPKDAETHSESVDVFASSATNHKFEPSRNEIDYLYKRMNGLVMVKFKKDCLDLPDKVYREIELKPSRSILNAASAIQAKAPNAITCMTLLRELSDGFQYIETVVGKETCELCKGTKVHTQPKYDREFTEIELMQGFYIDENGDQQQIEAGTETVACPNCDGTGTQDRIQRDIQMVPTPKEGALQDLLEELDDVGRIVIYGGFTGSIDRICGIVQKAQWKCIRVDGRGWHTDLPLTKPEEIIRYFQSGEGRVAFVGQPGAAGMGLTLTAAPLTCYYSNDFNAESRIQSEDRIHRAGMDVNRGATIVDLIHLPTDRKVLNNLKQKKRLQDISMGELKAILAAAESDAERAM